MKLWCGFLLLLLSTPAVAQLGAVVVNVSGVSCTNTMGQPGFDALTYSLSGGLKSDRADAAKAAKEPKLDDLSLTKHFDGCTQPLINLFLNGKTAPTLSVVQYASFGGTQLAALTITLTNATLNSYELSGATDSPATETLAFGYSKVCMTSVGQNADGSPKAPVTVCYDLASNRAT